MFIIFNQYLHCCDEQLCLLVIRKQGCLNPLQNHFKKLLFRLKPLSSFANHYHTHTTTHTQPYNYTHNHTTTHTTIRTHTHNHTTTHTTIKTPQTTIKTPHTTIQSLHTTIQPHTQPYNYHTQLPQRTIWRR